MAGSLTDYGETHLLDYLLGKQDTVPATWYLALFTASPTETGSLAAEAANYTRLAVTNNLANWPAAASGAPSTKSNGVQLVFAAASGATGTVTHIGLMDAASSGNMWCFADVSTPKSYAAGDVPVVDSGALQFTAD